MPETPVESLDQHRAWRDLRGIWNRGWASDDAPRAVAVARDAFDRACQRGEPTTILAAAEAWRDAADAPRFLPKLDEWLEAGGWTKPPPRKKTRADRSERRRRKPSPFEAMAALYMEEGSA